MNRSRSVSAVLLAVAFGASCQNSFGQGKANIVILATGGTIAGAAATGTQSGYTSGQVTIDAMINAVPGIKDLANLRGEQVANVGSQDMSFDIMLKVAKRINELLPALSAPATAIAEDPRTSSSVQGAHARSFLQLIIVGLRWRGRTEGHTISGVPRGVAQIHLK